MARLKKLKPDDIMNDADDAWKNNRTSNLNSIAKSAEKQGSTAKDAFDTNYVKDDTTGKWRERLTRAQIAAIKLTPKSTPEQNGTEGRRKGPR